MPDQSGRSTTPKPCPFPVPPGYGPCVKERGHAGLHDFPDACTRCGSVCPCLSPPARTPTPPGEGVSA